MKRERKRRKTRKRQSRRMLEQQKATWATRHRPQLTSRMNRNLPQPTRLKLPTQLWPDYSCGTWIGPALDSSLCFRTPTPPQTFVTWTRTLTTRGLEPSRLLVAYSCQLRSNLKCSVTVLLRFHLLWNSCIFYVHSKLCICDCCIWTHAVL